MDEEKKDELKPVFNSRRFGITLLCCAVAILIGVAVAVGAGRSITEKIELQSSEKTPTTAVTVPDAEMMTKEAAVDVTGVPDERNPTTEKTPEPTEKKENFVFPLSNNILKDYSDGVAVKSKTLGDWRVHNGIDFAGKQNDRVKAIRSGSVTAVYKDSLWGTVVEIDHGDGIVAKYCGLKEGSTPFAGDTVEQGGTIGTLSRIPCEIEDDIHLHFEISLGGKIVDPLSAMGMAE